MPSRSRRVVDIFVYIGIPVMLFAGVYMANERGKLNLRRSTCQFNLKELGVGLMQYRQDNNQCFPPIALSPAPKRSLLATSSTGPSYGWADAFQPYVKATSILNCPENRSVPIVSFYPEGPGYTDYWMNSHIAERNVSSADVIMMGDGSGPADARYVMSGLPANWENATDEKIEGESVKTQSPWFKRHLGGANYSFVDGHVKWLTPEQIGTVAKFDAK